MHNGGTTQHKGVASSTTRKGDCRASMRLAQRDCDCDCDCDCDQIGCRRSGCGGSMCGLQTVGNAAADKGLPKAMPLTALKMPDSRRRHHGVDLIAASSFYKRCVRPFSTAGSCSYITCPPRAFYLPDYPFHGKTYFTHQS
jgi:hypothetical protein